LSKLTIRALFIMFVLLLVNARPARAQGVNAYFGMGSATAPATPIPLTLTDPVSLISTSFARKHMGGLFGLFGADFMATSHWGFGGEYVFRFAQADYVPDIGLKARPSFYDFNAVVQPWTVSKRFVPVFQAGLGGAKVSYYVSQQSCSVLSGCSSSSTLVDSSNHFQFHFSGGIRWYFRENVFLRPQVDVRWIHNFNDPNTPTFGRNWVPQYAISIGYTSGSR
jgi:hypothetical protein